MPRKKHKAEDNVTRLSLIDQSQNVTVAAMGVKGSGPYAGMLLAAFRASAARTQRKLETRALRGIGVAFPLRHSQFKLIQISTKNKRE